MNIFSKLFSSAPSSSLSPDKTKHIQHLKELFTHTGQIYTQTPLYNNQQTHLIEYMMLHPQAGVILFNFFDYSATELKGITASKAEDKNANASIRTDSAKAFIEQRFKQVFHTQFAPVRSILICTQLSEAEFDSLDTSFHLLIPKHTVLFKDSSDEIYKNILLEETKASYDLDKIKRALFAELVISKTRSLATQEQENIIHLAPLEKQSLIYGLPGSGKSTSLVAKALYEKMKNPDLRLMLLSKSMCNVHKLQELIFSFIENSYWGLNPADINVSSYDSIRRRSREKEKYDLLICDDVSEEDLYPLRDLLSKNGKLLGSSHYKIEGFTHYNLSKNFRLSSALCAACEGFRVDNLDKSLTLVSGNIYMNLILNIQTLLKTCQSSDITIVQGHKDDLLQIQTEVDEYFTPMTYLFDDTENIKGIGLYPLSHLTCVMNKYIIIIIEDEQIDDYIELITRADEKTFILSQSEEVYNIVDIIKKRISKNETD